MLHDIVITGKLADLTEREGEVYHLIRVGYSNPTVGNLLGVKVGTVDTHVASILEKLLTFPYPKYHTRVLLLLLYDKLVEEGQVLVYDILKEEKGEPSIYEVHKI